MPPENLKFENGKLSATPEGILAATRALGGNKELATTALDKYISTEQAKLDRSPGGARGELVRSLSRNLERRLDEQKDNLLEGLKLSPESTQALKSLQTGENIAARKRLTESMIPRLETSQDSQNTPSQIQQTKGPTGGIGGAKIVLENRGDQLKRQESDAINGPKK